MISNLTGRKTFTIDMLYITKSALQVIETEASRHHQDAQGENETGGVLIGRRLDRTNRVEFLITVATGPGESAYHNPIEFNPDVAYINQQLDLHRAKYPHMDYIGTWHKHPLSYQTFSPGDIQTAHAIFDEPSYKMDEIINPIVWMDKGQFTIRYYYMNRQMAKKREAFIEIPQSKVHAIPEDHDLVRKEQSRGNGNSNVSTRINEEYRRLKERGYQIDLKQQGQEYYFTVTASSRPDIVIHLIAPSGYPTIPPSLLVEQHGKELKISDGGVINKWTFNAGRSYMVDIADGVLSNLPASIPTPPASGSATSRPARSSGHSTNQRETTQGKKNGFGLSPALLVAIGLGAALMVAILVVGIVTLFSPGTTASDQPDTTGLNPTSEPAGDAAPPPPTHEQNTEGNMGADGTGADSNMGIPTHEPAATPIPEPTTAATSPETTANSTGLSAEPSPVNDIDSSILISTFIITYTTSMRAYEQSRDIVQLEEAIRALEEIIEIRDANPDQPITEVGDFDINNIANTLAERRLERAAHLQKDMGRLDLAEIEYKTILESPDEIEPPLLQKAETGLANIERARQLWFTVQSSIEQNDFSAAIDALKQLQSLPGFGSEARDPDSGQTVGEMLDSLQQENMVGQDDQMEAQ
jgi:hypothetical protein